MIVQEANCPGNRGRVTRYYIEKLGGGSRVRSLTMLATPNYGTWVASFPCEFHAFFRPFDQGACDLVPTSPLLSSLNSNLIRNGVASYNVLAGTVGSDPILEKPNDCVVELSSAIGPGFPYSTFDVSHVGSGGGAEYIGCTGPGIVDDVAVRQQLVAILGDYTARQAMNDHVAGKNSNAQSPSSLASATGIVAGGQMAELEVPVPTGMSAVTFVFRSPTAGLPLEVSLVDPTGTVVSGGAGVTVQSGLGFGVDETRYEISSPTPGDWKMQVSAPSGSADSPYDMEAVVVDNVSANVTTGPSIPVVGRPVSVSAHLEIGGLAASSGSAQAIITKPDNTSTSIPLVSTSSGDYTGTFADTRACGVYQISAVFTGSIERRARTLLVVGVPGYRAGDPCISDSPLIGDADCDGSVTAVDALYALRTLAGLQSAGNCVQTAADVNCDGVLDTLDIRAILLYAAHLTGEEYPGCPAIGT
jgi:Dockerin type I domain